MSTALGKSTIDSMFEVDVAVPILRQNFVVLLAWEGRLFQSQKMEDHSSAENITNRTVLCLQIFQIHNFRAT